MGLDTFELLVEIEEEFSLVIPDEVGQTLETMGQVHKFVMATLQERGEMEDSADVLHRLSALVAYQTGVSPETLAPDTHFVYDLGMD